MVEFVSTCTIRNYFSNWGSTVTGLTELRSTTPASFSTGGANVVIGCSQGYVRVHEVLVRNFTTILDGLVGGSEAVLNEARDPYGGLNIIIPSLDRETLQCLTEMLYRGVTCAPNAGVKTKLMELTKLPVALSRGRLKKNSIKWPEVDFVMSSKPSINQSLLTKINPDHLEALLDEEKPSLGDSVEGPTIVDVRTEIDNDNEENGMEVEDNGTSFGEHAAEFDETQDNESYLTDDVSSNPFMEEGNFDASLVSSPVETADTQHPAPHYVKGRHPFWKEVFGINLLIDPRGAVGGGRHSSVRKTTKRGRGKGRSSTIAVKGVRNGPVAIAYWDSKHRKPYFFNRGFLHLDPLDPNQHRFSNDPRSNPLAVNQVISQGTNPRSNIATPSIVKKGHKPVQAKTKSAVLAYTEEFNPIQLLDDASLIIKDIFEERTITPTSSPENVRANIKELFGWFLGHYYRGYEKRFGFTVETMKAKLWPNKEVVKLLLNNLETAAPGLTRKYDKSGKEIPLPIQKQMMDRIINDNRHRGLKIQNKKRPLTQKEAAAAQKTSTNKLEDTTISDYKRRKTTSDQQPVLELSGDEFSSPQHHSLEEHDSVISADHQLMSLVHTKQETCDYYSPTVEDENLVDSLEHWSKDSLP